MRIDIITLFPEALKVPLDASVLGRGKNKELFDIRLIHLRDFATDKHSTVDDTPFGGGGGMVLKPEPLASALESLDIDFDNFDRQKTRILLTSAAGPKFDHQTAVKLSMIERIVIICGHYKGIDERILRLFPIDEISIGDFVLTGGEPAAWVMVDAIVRLIPGVVGNFESAIADSFAEDNLLGAPCYTRPAKFRGLSVPDELLSGNHREIEAFRRKTALAKTAENRPELLEKAELSQDDETFLKKIKKDK
ncbi:MAG: tRNA (guanosine(37)-N1)-methyltransferase TrmD [candidate division Zixibacteria bacterium]|nr:tRNA (guanosine(37)-N1)-methyltransferase TrmD [candidate division Zixibacteria bacterium]